jgi:hypothetical protein
MLAVQKIPIWLQGLHIGLQLHAVQAYPGQSPTHTKALIGTAVTR